MRFSDKVFIAAMGLGVAGAAVYGTQTSSDSLATIIGDSIGFAVPIGITWGIYHFAEGKISAMMKKRADKKKEGLK